MSDVQRTVYDFSAPPLNGGPPVGLDQFRGQVLVIVNTASRCGNTPQYAGLEQLYRTYKERGLRVLGFPCNQFGGQEPGSATEIASFCERNYGVSFSLFQKIEVNGPGAHPLYQFLKKAKPGIFGSQRIKWNFTKFLIDRQGSVVRRYAPTTQPKALAAAVEELLNAK
ncbi:MAG: glutathione peroxidase [Terracidiphilus sp.]|jgi:glutathione peroxidase